MKNDGRITDREARRLYRELSVIESKERAFMADGRLNYREDAELKRNLDRLAESREEASYFKKGTGSMAERIKLLNPSWTIPRKTTPVQYLNENGWLPKLDLGVAQLCGLP